VEWTITRPLEWNPQNAVLPSASDLTPTTEHKSELPCHITERAGLVPPGSPLSWFCVHETKSATTSLEPIHCDRARSLVRRPLVSPLEHRYARMHRSAGAGNVWRCASTTFGQHRLCCRKSWARIAPFPLRQRVPCSHVRPTCVSAVIRIQWTPPSVVCAHGLALIELAEASADKR
jgi:hypothetical protein